MDVLRDHHELPPTIEVVMFLTDDLSPLQPTYSSLEDAMLHLHDAFVFFLTSYANIAKLLDPVLCFLPPFLRINFFVCVCFSLSSTCQRSVQAAVYRMVERENLGRGSCSRMLDVCLLFLVVF